jgi:hypothetical protein
MGRVGNTASFAVTLHRKLFGILNPAAIAQLKHPVSSSD